MSFTTTIDGSVYVLTEEFMSRHPGGRDMIILAASRDASSLVGSYHRRDDVFRKSLATLTKLSGTDAEVAQTAHRAFDPHSQALLRTDSPLYTELKNRINAYFGNSNNSNNSRGGSIMILKSFFHIAITAFAYYISHIQGYFLLSPITGLMISMLGLCVQHDANHGALSTSPLLNRFFGFMDDVIGGSALCWKTQHVTGHHQHPNHHTLDSDSYGNFPLLRLNPVDKRYWYHAYQAYYAPLLYSLLAFVYPIRDMVDMAYRGHFHTPMPPLDATTLTLFWLGKILHYGLLWAVPLVLHGLSNGFLGLICPTLLTGGLFLAISFSVSHNVPSTAYNNTEDMCFAETQIRTSADWSPDSLISSFIWGGLNTQIIHHLFPGIAHIHYPALTRIVVDVCREKGIPYNAYPTFGSAVWAHFKQLDALGNGEDEDVHMGKTRSPVIASFENVHDKKSD